MSIQEIVESQMDQEALLLEVTKWNNRIGRYQDENRELLKTVRPRAPVSNDGRARPFWCSWRSTVYTNLRAG